jgi:hypothetical protein
LTGRSREMPGVATAVQPYGKGDDDKEERLELRTRSAATVGQAGIRAGIQAGVRAGVRPVAVNSSRDRDNHENGLLRIRRIGNRPSDVWCVSSCVIESVGSRQGNDVCVCTGRLHGRRGYRNTSED